jgi:hypothetical protein
MFRPHCDHLQANVYVDLKMSALRSKHVAKNF